MFDLNPSFSCPQRKQNLHTASLPGQLRSQAVETRDRNQSVHGLRSPGSYGRVTHRLCHVLWGGTLSLQRLAGLLLLLRPKSLIDCEIPLHTHEIFSVMLAQK